jgi:hypothetical protein
MGTSAEQFQARDGLSRSCATAHATDVTEAHIDLIGTASWDRTKDRQIHKPEDDE